MVVRDREEISSVLEEIKKEIVPSKDEENFVNNLAREIVEKFEEEGFDVVLGGSIGKGTWIKGEIDFDIFLRFSEEEINTCHKKIESAIKDKFSSDFVKIHGSRDYYRFKYRGCDVEVVPVLKIDKVEEAKTTTDFSVFHVKYVKEKIGENKKVLETIRIIKKFFKSVGIYGAESYISGFSGYASELIGIYYKTPESFFLDVENYRPKVFIDLSRKYRNLRDAIVTLGQDKTKSPIIVVDPINPNRNASAAVSYESFAKLVYYGRLFLRTLDKGLFFIKKSFEYLIKRAEMRGNLFFYEKYNIPPSKDVFLSKLKSTLKSAINTIKNRNVEVYDYGLFVNGDQVYIYFEIWGGKVYRHIGPNPWIEEIHFENFIKRAERKEVVGDIYIYKDRMCVDIKLPPPEKIKEEVINYINKRMFGKNG